MRLFDLSACCLECGYWCCRNLREKVVDNVELNDTMEQLTADEAEVSVDGGQSTLLESPGALLKVLSITVVVVEVSDGN